MSDEDWMTLAEQKENGIPTEVLLDSDLRQALGQKCPDNQTIPFCKKHHGNKTDLRGFFKNYDGYALRVFLDRRIYRYQQLYRDLVALGQTPWR
jgi:hypothetical protein